jgi:hypothetical protein
MFLYLPLHCLRASAISLRQLCFLFKFGVGKALISNVVAIASRGLSAADGSKDVAIYSTYLFA